MFSGGVKYSFKTEVVVPECNTAEWIICSRDPQLHGHFTMPVWTVLPFKLCRGVGNFH